MSGSPKSSAAPMTSPSRRGPDVVIGRGSIMHRLPGRRRRGCHACGALRKFSATTRAFPQRTCAPAVVGAGGATVTFADGSQIQPISVILATGYAPEVSWLPRISFGPAAAHENQRPGIVRCRHAQPRPARSRHDHRSPARRAHQITDRP